MPSDKILAQKQELVKGLADEFKSAQTLVIASSRGLTVAQDTEMRAAMREAGITFKVVKNSLALRAAQAIGLDELTEVFVGPTAIAYSTEDIVMPAKLAKQFAKKFEPFEIKGGAIDGVVSTLEEIDRLANTPDQETLYTQLAYILNFPMTKFAATLKAVIDKAEEEGKDQVADVVAPQEEVATEEAETADVAPEAEAQTEESTETAAGAEAAAPAESSEEATSDA